ITGIGAPDTQLNTRLTFDLTVGGETATVSLAPGDYSNAATLAAALQDAIDAAFGAPGAGLVTVSVSGGALSFHQGGAELVFSDAPVVTAPLGVDASPMAVRQALEALG